MERRIIRTPFAVARARAIDALRNNGLMPLEELQQRLVHPPQAAQFPCHGRNERRSRDRLGSPPDQETAPASPTALTARASPVPLASPAAFQTAPLAERQQVLLDRAQDRRKPPRAPAVRYPPPERFRNTTASAIWMSNQPWPPAARTCRRTASPSRLALRRSKYTARPPARSGRGAINRLRTGNRARPVPPSRIPLGMVFRVANQNCLLDSSVQRGTSIFLTLNPGADTLGCISEKLRIVCVDEVAA